MKTACIHRSDYRISNCTSANSRRTLLPSISSWHGASPSTWQQVTRKKSFLWVILVCRFGCEEWTLVAKLKTCSACPTCLFSHIRPCLLTNLLRSALTPFAKTSVAIDSHQIDSCLRHYCLFGNCASIVLPLYSFCFQMQMQEHLLVNLWNGVHSHVRLYNPSKEWNS